MRQITMLLTAALIAATISADTMRADAPALGLGPGVAVTGAIKAEGQIDRYELDVVIGRTYVIETFAVERGSGEGTHLSVYNASGVLLARGAPGAGDADQTLEITAPADEALEVRVVARGGWAGGYRMRALAAHDEPGAAWDARGEPDGWCSIGHELGIAQEAGGDIAAADPATISRYPDGDSYTLKLAAGRAYLVEVDSIPDDAPAGAVMLTTYDAETGFMLGGALSGEEGAAALLAITPQADARYCVGVNGGATTAPWSGAYRVRAIELTAHTFLPIVRQ